MARTCPQTAEARLRPVELLLAAAVVLFQLVLVGSIERIPFQDLPLHLENAAILAAHLHPGGSPLKTAFAAEIDPTAPNLLVYLLLVPLGGLLGATGSAKTILGLYLLLFPLAALYALSGIRRRAAFLTLAALPLSWSFPFTMGFLNFCFGVLSALAAVGFWARHRERMSSVAALALALLGLVTVFCHPVPFLFAAWIVGMGVLGTAWREASVAGSRRLALGPATRRPLAALLPGLAVILVFVGSSGAGDLARLSWGTLLKHLVTFNALVSFSLWERVPGAFYFLLLAAAALTVLRRGSGPPVSRALLGAAAVLGAIYFLAPAGIVGGGYLNPRLQLLSVLALLLWLASHPSTDGVRTWLAPAGAAVALALLLVQLPTLRELGRQAEEAVAVGAGVPAGSSLAILSWAHRGVGETGGDLSARSAPFQNLAGFLAAERGVVDLGNYHASQPYFPIRYREPCDPFLRLWTTDLALEPPGIDVEGWEAAGCRADHLLLWARRGASLPEGVTERYERVAVSGSGRAELYRRSPEAGPASTAYQRGPGSGSGTVSDRK